MCLGVYRLAEKADKGSCAGYNCKILAKGKDIAEVTFNLVEKLRSNEEIITLYYGQDVTEEEAEALAEKLREQYPDCDVEVLCGGQPIYYYYVALE